MAIVPDHIAHKSTTDNEGQIASAIEPSGTDPCLPGEIVCERQEGNTYIYSLDANNSSQRINGHLKNENKGSFTVSNNGEGASSILLNANAVTAEKIADGTIQNEKIAGPIPISKGGTGGTTVSSAITSLLPAQAPVLTLLHFDGADNSTSFTESSYQSLSTVASGTTRIRTAQSKFGGSSAFISGNGSYLTVGSANQVDLLGEVFTIEAWIYVSSFTSEGRSIASGDGIIWGVDAGAAGTSHWQFKTFGSGSTGRVNFRYVNNSNGTNDISSPAGGIPVNTWTHVCVCNAGGQPIHIGVNGTVTTESSNLTVPLRPSNDVTLRIGGSPLSAGFTNPANYNWDGYIDDFRIIKGYALYTSNYAVPTRAFPDPSDRPFALGTSGTSVRWQPTASRFKDFDDVNDQVESSLDSQFLKWNSSSSEWTPSEYVNKTGILSTISPSRNGELARDEEALYISTGTNQWKRIELNTWT